MGLKGMEGGRRVGLEGVKGIGFNGVTAIMKARQAGPFKLPFDFPEGVEEGSINKRVLEGLVYSGAFDSLKPSEVTTNHWRARLFAAIDVALARSARAKRAKAIGQNDLFGGEAMLNPD